MKIGIDAIAFAVPRLYLDMNDLAQARGIDPAKYIKGLGQTEMAVAAPCEDAVSLAAEAGLGVLKNFNVDPESIGLVIVGTETPVDQSKPVAVYLQQLLGLSTTCRTFEIKHACYGAMAGLTLATDWILSGRSGGKKALIVASDIARYGARTPGEPTQGAGAVAMLISEQPRLIAFRTDRQGYFSRQVMDFWRPNYSKEAFTDGHYSIQCYLEALAGCYGMYTDGKMNLGGSLSACLYHSPFVKMAQKAHQKFLELERGSPFAESELPQMLNDHAQRVRPFLEINSRIGNAYTASLFLSLINLLEESAALEPSRLEPQISLFSYGSGCVAEFLTATIQPGASDWMKRNPYRKVLKTRRRINVTEYEGILEIAGRADADGVNCDPKQWGIDRQVVYLGNRSHQRDYRIEGRSPVAESRGLREAPGAPASPGLRPEV